MKFRVTVYTPDRDMKLYWSRLEKPGELEDEMTASSENVPLNICAQWRFWSDRECWMRSLIRIFLGLILVA